MTTNEVKQIFDSSFSDVTKKLVCLEVRGIEQTEEERFSGDNLSSGVREKIETLGAVNVTVICRFSDQLFWYIIETMHGGTPPSEEEIPLYLNEYMNIICGHAISRINNITKTKSRLSLPEFYSEQEQIELSDVKEKRQYLAYESQYGMLQVYLFINMEEGGSLHGKNNNPCGG